LNLLRIKLPEVAISADGNYINIHFQRTPNCRRRNKNNEKYF
jgi:hypothetical protein